MAIAEYQYITYKNVDGVAVVNFLETVSMFDGDKVRDVGNELLDLVDSKKYTKLAAQHDQRPVRLQRDARTPGEAAPASPGSQRQDPALLPSPGDHGRLPREQLRQDLRDLSRRGGGPQEVLTGTSCAGRGACGSSQMAAASQSDCVDE